MVKIPTEVTIGTAICTLAQTKAANTLITKISDAIGILYEPHHKIRLAKAQVKSNAILNQSNLEQQALAERACQRMVHEEIQKQLNIENIISRTITKLEENSQVESLENDWITHLFEKAKLTSDGVAQELWAKVLATEANASGSISKRTVSIIAELEKKEAELFIKLADQTFYSGSLGIPLVFYSNKENNIINFSDLSHLDSIGLIKFNSFSGFSISHIKSNLLNNDFLLRYHNRGLIIKDKSDSQELTLSCGNVLYTKTGSEILKIFQSNYSENIFNDCYNKLKNNNKNFDISISPYLYSII